MWIKILETWQAIKYYIGRGFYIAGAWWDFLRGVRIADREHRMKICHTCINNTMGICGKCGCVISVKANEKYEECPVKKW